MLPKELSSSAHPPTRQYVSALRPPKRRRIQASTGTSIDSDVDEEIWSQNKLFQRRTSLTFPKPLGTRESFHNRSLQDFTNRIKLNVEDELDSQRRKQSIYNWSGTEKEVQARSPPQSSDSLNNDTLNDEWKQVMNE